MYNINQYKTSKTISETAYIKQSRQKHINILKQSKQPQTVRKLLNFRNYINLQFVEPLNKICFNEGKNNRA